MSQQKHNLVEVNWLCKLATPVITPNLSQGGCPLKEPMTQESTICIRMMDLTPTTIVPVMLPNKDLCRWPGARSCKVRSGRSVTVMSQQL